MHKVTRSLTTLPKVRDLKPTDDAFISLIEKGFVSSLMPSSIHLQEAALSPRQAKGHHTTSKHPLMCQVLWRN